MVGTVAHLKTAISLIEELVPACEFFLKMEKSHFVRAPGVSDEAIRADIPPLECIHG